MYYSEEPNHVRVDFFTKSGQWYTTEEVLWDESLYWASGTNEERNRVMYNGEWMHSVDIFKKTLRNHLGERLKGMWAVCLDPYCANGFPLMVKIDA